MADISRDPPALFFKERLEEAVREHHFTFSEPVMFYAVTLLSSIGNRRFLEEPLGERLVQADSKTGAERWRLLRTTGDDALLIVGFCSNSLNRRMISLNYFIDVGIRAYEVLGDEDEGALADTFQELAKKFMPLADVIEEVSSRVSLTDVRNILAMYERWQKTRSPRLAKRLAEMGIQVVAVSSKAQ